MQKQYIVITIAFIGIILLLYLFIPKQKAYSRNIFAMGAFADIKIISDKPAYEINSILNECIKEMYRIEKKFSRFDKNSVISMLNNRSNKSHEIPLDDESIGLINTSLQINKLSDGFFDPTIAPAIEIWKNALKNNKIPDTLKLTEMKKNLGADKISIDFSAKTISFQNDMIKLDLNAIITGYAVDRVITILKDRGIRNALLNAGGDIYCLGNGPKGYGWQVGIQIPFVNGSIGKKIYLKNKAVTTSGGYENFYTLGTKKYSHIINPKNLLLDENINYSVTVIADNCTFADAFATAMVLINPTHIPEMIKRAKLDTVIIIDSQQDIHSFSKISDR